MGGEERKYTLVVVDDDPAFLQLACRYLTHAGYAVEEFSDSLVALEYILATPPDLILADILMPGLDGYGMLGALRSQPSTAAIPVVFMTAVRDARAQRKCMRLGADDFLVKPISRADLVESVKARIERAQVMRMAGAGGTALQAGVRSAIDPQSSTDTVTMLVALADIARSGDYRIVRKLGEGGMSKVYLAEEPQTARRVVLKILRFEEDIRDDFVHRFLREHALLRRVSNSHVARVFANGITEHCAYLVMEHFSGGSLRSRMNQPLGPAMAYRIMCDIAAGVASLHGHDIVHRDLKPENVMLRADGSLAITDFGNAADLATAAGRIQDDIVTGTPAYMSPEHARGDPVSRASDVYSLGVVFFELLAGHRPFFAHNVKGLMHQHAVAPVPRLPHAAGFFQDLVDAMLAKAPAARPADAGAVVALLGELRPQVQVLAPADNLA